MRQQILLVVVCMGKGVSGILQMGNAMGGHGHAWIRVHLKTFYSSEAKRSLKYSDQYLLLQFCSRSAVSFLQAL